VIRKQLRTYLLENFMFGASPEDLNDDASLLETGVLDSTGVLELVLHLEETYGIAVDTADLVPENLDSIDRLQAFLKRKGVEVGV
jgi:acyl carrier protein